MKYPALHPAALLAAIALHAAANAAPLQITAPNGFNSFGPSLSEDGNRLAFYSASNLTGQNSDGNFEIYLYDRPTGSLHQITNDTRGIGSGSQLPTLSGDGSRIVFQSFETRGQTGFFRSQYYDVATNQIVSLNDYTSQFQLTDIGRDGRQIALNRDNDGLRIIDTATGTSGALLAFSLSSFTMSGDARRIATDSFSGGVRFIDVVAGTTIHVSPDGSGFNQNPDFSGDGGTIAFGSNFDPLGTNGDHNQELFLYEVASGHYRQVTNTTRSSNSEASISADGLRVAFTSSADLVGDNADGNQEIFVYDLLDDEIMQITRTAGPGLFSIDGGLSGDGLTLAYSSSGDFTGNNPNRIPQIFLQSLAPRANAVPEPSSLGLAAAALAALACLGRRQPWRPTGRWCSSRRPARA
jgi:Tol biopolymer transport system component